MTGLNSEVFLEERKAIAVDYHEKDPDGEYVSYVPLKQYFYFRRGSNLYQIIGINATTMHEKYMELFVCIDLLNTMQHFDGDAVHSVYFDVEKLNEMTEITEEVAKENYQRADWRRLQKYIKKEKMRIIKNENHEVKPIA